MLFAAYSHSCQLHLLHGSIHGQSWITGGFHLTTAANQAAYPAGVQVPLACNTISAINDDNNNNTNNIHMHADVGHSCQALRLRPCLPVQSTGLLGLVGPLTAGIWHGPSSSALVLWWYSAVHRRQSKAEAQTNQSTLCGKRHCTALQL
jgi:hypothetical protein